MNLTNPYRGGQRGVVQEFQVPLQYDDGSRETNET